jgi:hypothetical protein
MVVSMRWKVSYHRIMENELSSNSLPFDHPASYQITVQGRIDPAWSDRLDGMTIHCASEDTSLSFTMLEGELNDQAALAGVLNTLYELHLTVYLVNRLNA